MSEKTVIAMGFISPADENGYRIRMAFHSNGENVDTDVAVVDSNGPVKVFGEDF